MRNLTVQRRRALAGFAILYYFIPDADPRAYLGKMSFEEFQELIERDGGTALRNGETKTIEIDETEHTLTAVLWRQVGNYVMQPALIPAGADDAAFSLVTDYNGNDKLEFYLCPM